MAYLVIHNDNNVTINMVHPFSNGKRGNNVKRAVRIPTIIQFIESQPYYCFHADQIVRRSNYKSTKLIRLIMTDIAISSLPVECYSVIFNFVKPYEWFQIITNAGSI